MSFDVVVENLREAARGTQAVADPIATYDLCVPALPGSATGHLELADWLPVLAALCDDRGRALHERTAGTAAALRQTADQYERTDQLTRDGFWALLARLRTPADSPLVRRLP